MILSKYGNRQDKLEQRQTYKLEARVVERFGRGRDEKLAEVKPINWVVERFCRGRDEKLAQVRPINWRPRWSRRGLAEAAMKN